jgi:transposase-like protein
MMGKSILDQPIFHDDDAARSYLEGLRWPEGAVCPHCGTVGKSTKLEGKKHRPGLYKCNACRKQYTVTVGTVFERSKVPLHKWLLATYLICSSKKGISSHQLMRMLGVQYKTAWFMSHRIREAMHDGTLPPMGGSGQVVEVDETFWGQLPDVPKGQAYHHKMKVLSLVERGGHVRSFHVDKVSPLTITPILCNNILAGSRVQTDESIIYKQLHRAFPAHETVCHRDGEYSRGDVTTNTVEGYFSLVKRGLVGTFHHVGVNHLEAYLHEFDFRYNYRDVTDVERTDAALMGIAGKRLYYRH